MIMGEKHVAKSLAVRGGILAILVAFGIVGAEEVDAFSSETETLILAASALIGGVSSIVGRWRAKDRLKI